VGIAIPSYLGRDLIGRTLASVIAQTHGEWSCVVVNDGADDGTRDVVAALRDHRIRYVCDGLRRGQFGNFNRAILEALKDDPDVLRLLCGDDVLYPHDLTDMVDAFRRHPRAGLVATHYDGIDEADRLVFRVDMSGRDEIAMPGREYLLKGVAVGNTIGGPSSVALRRTAIETAGLFDTRVDHSGESDLWHRVAARWDIVWIGHRAGFQYRFHNASITGRGKYSVAKFTDPIQLVRRVASTEPLLGPRWWVHQYTIGRLHSINLQLIAAMTRRKQWDGVKAGLQAAWREGMLLYAPFWIPRIPWIILSIVRGRNPARRVLWRRVHERLQPRRVPVNPGYLDTPAEPTLQRSTSTN
jgi:hypothetical protein